MQAEPSEREQLLDEVVTNYLRAVGAGQTPDRGELLARYPDLAADLNEFFADQDQVQELAAPLRSIAPAPGATGQTFGDFEAGEEIGRGGMGIVYKARQKSLNRTVALKVLPLAATMDARQLRRFHNEAQAAAGLHHTNIVPVYFVGCEGGVHFYAMQYIEGRDLASVIAQLREPARGPKPDPQTAETVDAAAGQAVTPPAPAAVDTRPIAGLSTEGPTRSREYFRTVARLGIQAAEALDHAHQMGIIHRDVKPANLLVDADGRLWVTDFGLAHMQSETRLTMTGDLVGTLRYMSPEQALAKRVVVDHRTDIYSLGATLYELLTLEPAFNGRDRQELLRQIAFEEPRPPRRINRAIPDELETIVLKALEKNPAERYATAQDLADDLRRVLEDQPIRARRPSLLRRARKWAQRHRAGVAAAASVLLLSLTILAASVGWLAHDYTGRRTETERAVTAALTGSTSWQEQRRLPEALSAARRAVGVADGGTADDALRRRVRQRVADLELLERLENIRLEKLTAAADGHFDRVGADAAYGQTFREAGLDVESLPAEEAAERIRRSTVTVELAAVLDHWALVRRAIKGAADPSWKALLRVARLADDDAWRTRVREALEKMDQPALRELASSEEVFGLPVATLAVLAHVLLEDKDARGPAEVFLREAQRRHPNDFWLNLDLDHCLMTMQPRQPEEAVRFATVAVALRPGSAGAHFNLGISLKAKGRLDDAIAEYRKAIALDPQLAAPHVGIGTVLYGLHDQGRLDEAIAECQKGIALDPKFVSAYNNLGSAFFAKGRLDDAIAAFQKAIALDPQYATPHCNLGNALRRKGQLDDAIAEYQKAIALDPNDAIAHHRLGDALKANGRLDDAILEFQKSTEIDTKFAAGHHDLGAALADKGRRDDAIAEFDKAIAINPRNAKAHSDLGGVLAEQGRLDEAIAECRKAIALDPKLAPAYNNLGSVSSAKGRLDDAIEEFRKAIAIDLKYGTAHYNLGNALRAKGRLDDAIEEFRKAIAIGPNNAAAHNNLGDALDEKGQLDDAIAEFQKAIAVDPKYARAHCNLGVGLRKKGQLDKAIAEFTEAIQLKEDYADAYCNLGFALQDQGRFTDALVQFRRGHELGSRNSRWSNPSAQWVRNCERLIALDGKLPAVLSGEKEPADTAERLGLAQLCQMPCKKHFAAAQRFYSEAFAAEPKLAENLNAQHRYNAACAAALAGCGQGEEADKLDEKERARLRQQSLDWLRADLKTYRRDLEIIPDKAAGAIAQRMQHWLQDNDFAGVRGPDVLAKLLEAEREEWQKLWQEVEALRQRAAKPPADANPARP